MSKVLSDGIACENTADPYKTQLASASNRKCEAGILKLPILTVELWMELFSPNLEIFQQKLLEERDKSVQWFLTLWSSELRTYTWGAKIANLCTSKRLWVLECLWFTSCLAAMSFNRTRCQPHLPASQWLKHSCLWHLWAHVQYAQVDDA